MNNQLSPEQLQKASDADPAAVAMGLIDAGHLLGEHYEALRTRFDQGAGVIYQLIQERDHYKQALRMYEEKFGHIKAGAN